MAYAFEHDEPLSVAIPRLMHEQIARAREQLTDKSAPQEKRVHDARKRFKETRALLRMIREPLGGQFAIENAWFRDAGRELAAVRDADAVLEALEKLVDLPRGVRTKVKRALKKNRAHSPLDGLIANMLDQLVVAQARVDLWPAMADSFDTIAGGLQKTYRDGRRAMKDAHSAEALHEWRKAVKTHWYHLQLLRNIWPLLMKAHAGALDELSHALGDHHDLHVLAGSVDPAPPELLDAIAKRQRELEAQALALGARIYAERPRAFLARMRNWWSAWR
ncbi:MAG TPA: CHAD domain-containing protein [Thermoanaerobaculia bacterium]|nr:CHAD domain-containing protein [Thermoanaerobaculia bacterium]